MTSRDTCRRASALAACALLLSLLSVSGCGGGGGEQPDAKADSGPGAQAGGPAAANAGADSSRLDGEIERLEKVAQRNPGDDETRDQLAGAYVRRANSLRAAQKLKEALLDYQRAMRINPDNEEAQKNAFELMPLVQGTPQEGEYGEPPPPPITPNVIGSEEKASPTATPRKQ